VPSEQDLCQEDAERDARAQEGAVAGRLQNAVRPLRQPLAEALWLPRRGQNPHLPRPHEGQPHGQRHPLCQDEHPHRQPREIRQGAGHR